MWDNHFKRFSAGPGRKAGFGGNYGMKRRIFLLLLAAALCLTAAASAIELTFAQTCWDKTSRDVTLYVRVEEGGSLIAAQTLPAGTYIRPTGDTAEGKAGISYGFEQYGYIDGSAIVSASRTITLPSGRQVPVPEALVNSRQAMNLWLDVEYGETLDGGTYTDENGVEHQLGNEAAEGSELEMAGDAKWGKAMSLAYAHNGRTRTVYRDDDGNETDVLVCYMGLARSRVILNGEEQMVETWRLSWETEAPESKVLAVVAPKSAGEVRLLATNKAKATVLTRVKTNRVVQVIKTGKNWTLVDINDSETPRGYISTDVLDFYSNEPMAYRPALLSAAGRTKGSDPVWIRSSASSKARRITQFDLGEPLSVYCQNEQGWCEVDVGGFHAFILSDFVTLEDDITGKE